MRQATAFVLSQASRQLIAVNELWPGSAAHDSRLIPAIAGMEAPWTLAGTLERLRYVNSPCCLASLRRLASELRARKLNPHIRDFSAELDRKLHLAA